jgi:glycopeptide antibiotics resistance protein
MLDGRWIYLAALPVAAGLIGSGAGRGRRMDALIALLALGHLAVLANVALFPIPSDPDMIAQGRTAAASAIGLGGLNLVPFATIGPVLGGAASAQAVRIAVLNVFVLTPAGICFPIMFRPLRRWRALVPVAIVGGASVEAAQLTISTALGFRYRTIDIDDVILNTIGIVIGWLIVKLSLRVVPGRRGIDAQQMTLLERNVPDVRVDRQVGDLAGRVRVADLAAVDDDVPEAQSAERMRRVGAGTARPQPGIPRPVVRQAERRRDPRSRD